MHVWTIFRKEAWPLGEHPELFRVSVQAYYHESDVGEFVEVSLADQVLSCVQGFCAKKIKFMYCQRTPPHMWDAWAVPRQGQLEQQKAERMVHGLPTSPTKQSKSTGNRISLIEQLADVCALRAPRRSQEAAILMPC